ncbi:MAG: peptide ABC transporter substrate-binding protein [Acidobacteria bacterium]|nr:peptide ABC transporter substrate-binding protein [Acidobacteriota bacterium]
MAGLALAMLTLSCARENDFPSTPTPAPSALRIGNGADPGTLDPGLARSSAEEQILINLFEGLVEYDVSGSELKPALAESWTADPECRRFVFILRRDGRWSNGDPVTAHDFVYSWRRVLDPRTGSPQAYMLYRIRNAQALHGGRPGIRGEDLGIRALDDYRLEVDLTGPTCHFPRMLANSVCRPVHRRTVEQWREQWTQPEHMVSNGPFTLASWRPADRVVLVRNPSYRGADQVSLEEAVYLLTNDPNTILNLYEAGELDTMVTGHLPLPHIPRLRELPDYRSGPFLATYFYTVNVSRPPLNDLRVRRALSLALDREAICTQLLRSGQSPAYFLTSSDFQGAYPRPRIEGRNLELARSLLADAGYPGGENLRLHLLFNSNSLQASIAQAIQGQWQGAFPAAQVNLVNQELKVYLDALHRRDFDLARRVWAADYDDPSAFLEIMTSSSENNASQWKSPAFDRLIEEAGASADPAQRMERLARAEAAMLAELPIIPIYSLVTFFLTKPYVRGWEDHPLDRHPLKYVRLER